MVWRKHAQSSERHEHSVIVHRAIVHGKCPVGEVVRSTGSARVHACCGGERRHAWSESMDVRMHAQYARHEMYW